MQASTVNFLNIRTPQKIVVVTMWLYHRVMSPNDADGMANSVDPERSSLIWVCTVCLGISVRKLRIVTVNVFLKLLMGKDNITLSNLKETRTMGRMTS